jgi:hypothetical protein
MKRNLVCAFAAIAASACAPDSVMPAGKLPPLTGPAEAGVSVEPVSESEGRKLLSRTVFTEVLH